MPPETMVPFQKVPSKSPRAGWALTGEWTSPVRACAGAALTRTLAWRPSPVKGHVAGPLKILPVAPPLASPPSASAIPAPGSRLPARHAVQGRRPLSRQLADHQPYQHPLLCAETPYGRPGQGAPRPLRGQRHTARPRPPRAAQLPAAEAPVSPPRPRVTLTQHQRPAARARSCQHRHARRRGFPHRLTDLHWPWNLRATAYVHESCCGGTILYGVCAPSMAFLPYKVGRFFSPVLGRANRQLGTVISRGRPCLANGPPIHALLAPASPSKAKLIWTRSRERRSRQRSRNSPGKVYPPEKKVPSKKCHRPGLPDGASPCPPGGLGNNWRMAPIKKSAIPNGAIPKSAVEKVPSKKCHSKKVPSQKVPFEKVPLEKSAMDPAPSKASLDAVKANWRMAPKNRSQRKQHLGPPSKCPALPDPLMGRCYNKSSQGSG